MLISKKKGGVTLKFAAPNILLKWCVIFFKNHEIHLILVISGVIPGVRH